MQNLAKVEIIGDIHVGADELEKLLQKLANRRTCNVAVKLDNRK